MSPGVTSFPPASITSAALDAAIFGPMAAILPPRIPTSATRSMRCPGSRTRPPLINRSYSAANKRGTRVSNTGAAAQARRSWRRLIDSKVFIALFTGQMLDVLIVLVADEFHQLRIRQQVYVLIHRPGLRISLGIVDGDLKIHVPEILPLEALDHMQRVGRRPPHLIQPGLAVEPLGIHHQRRALPLPH